MVKWALGSSVRLCNRCKLLISLYLIKAGGLAREESRHLTRLLLPLCLSPVEPGAPAARWRRGDSPTLNIELSAVPKTIRLRWCDPFCTARKLTSRCGRLWVNLPRSLISIFITHWTAGLLLSPCSNTSEQRPKTETKSKNITSYI